MREFLEYVGGQLAERSEEMVLTEDTRGETHKFILHLPSAEVGKVIGKQGQTIRAIRNLLAAAARQRRHYSFEIAERLAPVN